MKKNKLVGIIMIICGIVLLYYMYNSFFNNRLKRISEIIELDINECKMEYNKDTHGGFLGDGDYFARIKCSNIDYDKLTSNWKELPLTESINWALDIKNCDSNGCKNVYERYLIPNIENGYYYFLDRHSDSKDKYDDSEINDRSSWNFSLAMIDKNTNIIYYYVLDT